MQGPEGEVAVAGFEDARVQPADEGQAVDDLSGALHGLPSV